MKLYHVSEESGITRFDPRPYETASHPVVWAVSDERLHNYLVPRDCPRVTFYAGQQTSSADVTRFLGLSRAVVAIEEAWLDRLRHCQLHCYEFPSDTFSCIDECAGYYVSQQPVEPTRVHLLEDLPKELTRRQIELRIVPELWSLRDAVIASTFSFSIIRMRNAQPRAVGSHSSSSINFGPIAS